MCPNIVIDINEEEFYRVDRSNVFYQDITTKPNETQFRRYKRK